MTDDKQAAQEALDEMTERYGIKLPTRWYDRHFDTVTKALQAMIDMSTEHTYPEDVYKKQEECNTSDYNNAPDEPFYIGNNLEDAHRRASRADD